jgi:RimJ/RimL family protein N-acetyltransferase
MPRTDRLLLRRWLPRDLDDFAAMNADPEVMEFFPAPYTREQSAQQAEQFDAEIVEHGFGLWAIEVGDGPERGRFAGFTGLSVPGFDAPFGPSIEVGWRLARWAWGRGYATEAARASLEIGFREHGLDEIVSFTSVPNVRSQAVMERIGMTRDPADDFDHPLVPSESGLQRHVLYRSSAPIA